MADSERARAGAQIYQGGCACGRVRFEVDLGRPSEREGLASSVWERAVAGEAFRLLEGGEALRGYQFFENSAHHFFCAHCGVRSFSRRAVERGRTLYSFDLKCLHARACSAAS